MRTGFTLGRYLIGQFFSSIVIVLAICAGIIFLADLVELIRRTAKSPDLSFGTLSGMALLHVPSIAQQALPFAVLFGALWTFLRLTRNQELVVARTSGVSVWGFLAPALLVAVTIGIFTATVYNPVAASMFTRYEHFKAKYIRGQVSLLAVSSSGLWLRQVNQDGPSVINAQRASQGGALLEEVTIYLYDPSDHFSGRLDAKSARLEDGYWQLEDIWKTAPDEPVTHFDQMALATPLSVDRIQDSFAPPESLSFWALPGFIRLLEDSGFSAVRHRLYWHAVLSLPLLLSAMVVIAAAFSLREHKFGGMTILIGGCVLTGFGFFILSNVALALGMSGTIPPLAAAWTPAAIAGLLGAAALFHIEDG